MRTPFFSVIIPTFNRAHILSRSIDSVLGQTYTDFELIVIDNGSTDNTQQWLSRTYQDDRLSYVYQQGSGSPASPRNHGISLAKGGWVCFLDSDDMWTKDKLQSVFDAVQSSVDVDVVCHNEYVFLEESQSKGKMLKYGPNSKNMYRDMLLSGGRLSTSATSVRLDFLRRHNLRFNELNEFATVEDYDLWLHLAKSKANFGFIPEALGFYTISNSNMVFTSGLFCRNLYNLLRQHAFNIQEFSANKQSLWRVIKLRADVCQIQHGELKTLSKILLIIKLFVQHPVNFSIVLGNYAKKKSISHMIVLTKK